MIAEIRLVSNDAASTARFWGGIFNVTPEDLGVDRWGVDWWRIEPAVGPDVVVSAARTVEAITSVDMIASCDAAAPDRLRELGFEVSLPGEPLQAVDVNGTDSTVHLVVHRGWDDIDWDEPDESAWLDELVTTAVTGRLEQIQTAYPGPVTRFLSAWFGIPADRQVPAVSRFVIRDTLLRVSYTAHPERRWIPVGTRDYPAAVERCAAAGFEVVPSAGGPVGGHLELGGHVFLLVDLPDSDQRP
ncbi:Uncharacterised protein [Mycobacteroides abscessus subsp. abscessus]|uniref:hypothetical protein n=1 Tax=Mycobacteroides abscessus TaxID=36809 RepID=UPI0009C449D4|nr:hypothetical protein [Mycobacteroides abscessus]SLJ23798.1 Uncharacterised protein [Mycobacteroides abscessus subsp. abscessus]